jgi:dihydrolipoamide dehydrogenase
LRESYDLIVIGGGPGGYPAAIRASQLGLNTALIDGGKLGGECTNYGCIPTKSMIKASNLIYTVGSQQYIKGDLSLDYKLMMEWVDDIVGRIRGGIEYLLKGYNIDVYHGRARFIDHDTVDVDTFGELRGEKFIVATGTMPVILPGLEPDNQIIFDNRGILNLGDKPSSILIVGGGYIGVEYATIFAKLGVDTYIVELLDRLLPNMDKDFSRIVTRRLKSLGVKVYTSSRVDEVDRRENYIRVRISGDRSLEVDKMLVAVGRRPSTKDLNLENIDVELDKDGYIVVDSHMRTSNKNIYASGDVTGGDLLAHKAFRQACVAAENAAGKDTIYEPLAVPSVVYTDPELVSIGYSVDRALKEGYDAIEIRYPIGGVARAIIEGETDGFVKIIYEKDSMTVLGVFIAAPHASEIAGEAALSIEMGATLEDLSLTIHPHPTVSEALKEAAELAIEAPIHYLLKKGGR